MNATLGILTYRRLDMLKACLESVFAHTSEAGLQNVIVTNTSTDPGYQQQAAALLQNFPRATYHAFGENLGCARAWNWMARWRPQTEIIAIFNDDVKVFSGWERAVKETLADPRMGLMSLSLANGSECWEHQEARNPPIDLASVRLARYVCSYPTGALLMLRREVYDQAGGFDEQFFQALEEVDLGVRLARRGYINANVGTDGEIYKFAAHFGSASGGSEPLKGDMTPQAEERKQRQGLYFEKKHGFPFPFPEGLEAQLTAHMRVG